MREEEIIQMMPGQFGWFAYGRDEQGSEFLAPVACWALVESKGNVRRVVGLTAHGLDHVTRLEERGNRCPECGHAPGERRPPVPVYPDEPERGFEGDAYESCSACGRPLYTVVRVVYGDEGGGGDTYWRNARA